MAKISNLCFPLKENQILLALKKGGFGAGKVNGFGGKVEKNEGIEESLIREVWEECRLEVRRKSLVKAAELDFYLKKGNDYNHLTQCHIFLVKKLFGNPVESAEMKPKWYETKKIPYGDMWEADQFFLPVILGGEIIKGRVIYNHNGSRVLEFSYRTTKF
ncbi:hypothetical protein A2999_00800 [Candidatus Wolfebacteria bacterium RIFCSPLOWO2_01_FULL_38_11]|uniref:NUDIX hydrolase n=2 Tax=Candidatus Wolfeibacteriota TaxID=1752735 RepID=A0A0G0G7X8_9BACT|nr:MAG: NUDIX hydrolase [Candidatus Wolfebacteria bacterium GW2011_GWC1_37_10]OGM90462.1 MAG: hypothetical protein A2999_00800 [Candidatus Wolfebacteria bacterium RIFCSPLOWO2_01_FULL_38_11]